MPLKDVRHLILGEEGTFVEISVSKAVSQVDPILGGTWYYNAFRTVLPFPT
jgi:hypothetical protein